MPISESFEDLQTRIEDIRESDISASQEEIIKLLELIETLNRTDPESACILTEQVLSITQELELEVYCAKCYKIIGISYLSRGGYEKALDCSLKALEIYEDTDDKNGVSSTLNTIGIIYGKRKDHVNALKYYLRSLSISEEIGDIKGIAKTNNNLGNIYQDQGDFEKALEFAEKSLQSFTELEDDLGIASSCNNIGIILEFKGDRDTAKEHFQRAYELFKRIEYKTGFAASCNNLGELLTAQGEFKQAECYLNQALKAAKEVDAKYREIRVYEHLSNLYEEMGNFRGALDYYRKFSELSRKVFGEESSKNMFQLQIKFETEKKKKEAEIYKLKNIELQKEISERIHVEEELRKHQDQLEELINERTIELMNSYNKLERGFQGTIVLISKITELRDPYTSGHQIRVAKLASTIAREMELPEEKIEAIHIASLVHDIGKINVPQEILSKPGILTDLEMRMIQIHPQAGYSILSEINFPWPIAEIVREHHEHIDGSGYPQGLKTDDIAIEARIICVADVIEAMSFRRPYRAVLGMKEAVQEITDNEGILYDKDVVRVCKKVICEKGFSFD